MSIYEQLPQTNSLNGVWTATVATDSAAIGDSIDVVINSFSDQHRFGPCLWMPRDATSLPARGDNALVVFDEDRIPYVIMWW